MDHQLRVSLNNVILHINKFKYISTNSKINKDILDLNTSEIKDFLHNLTALSILIKNNRSYDFTNFAIKNIDALKLLKTVINGKDFDFYKPYYSTNLKSKINQLYNIIYITTNFKDIIGSRTDFITETFTEFCKGITYFQSELQWPIYHRNLSCGSERVNSDYKFIKTLYGPYNSFMLKLCYIEREIYNKIYIQNLELQNLGHNLELQRVKRILNNYFPYQNINVNIIFSNNYPTKIIIETQDNEYNTLDREIYTRTLNSNNNYDDNVQCFREKDGINYTKIQTFSNIQQWTQI